MILPVLQYPDTRLFHKSVPIETITPEIKTLATDMAETMYARNGVGLAAPQVNHFIRLLVVDISGPEERSGLMTLVNPVLTLSGPDVDSEEGCLSVSDFRSEVLRYKFAHLEATNIEGEPISLDAEGFLAICLQHEYDHLEGKLFIDRISRLKRMMYDKKINKQKK